MPIISNFPTGESTVDYVGSKSGMPSLEEGKVGYATDEKRLYTGNADGVNTQVPNADDLKTKTSDAVSSHNSAEDAHAEKFAKYLPLAGGTMTGQIVGAKATENVPTVVSQKTPTETGRSTALILQSGDDTDYNYSGIGVYDATAKKYLIPVGVIAFDGDGTVGRLISEDSKRTALGHVSVAPWGIDIGHTSGGVTIKNVVEPTEDTMPTPKSYVDNAIGNLTPSAHKVTLSTSGWNSSTKQQTVNCADVVADETAQQILPMPATASMTAYNDAGIQCVAQAAGTLTFQCETVPTAAIDVYVTITPVSFS